MCGQARSPVHTSSLTHTRHPCHDQAAREAASARPGGEQGDNSHLSPSHRPSHSPLPSLAHLHACSMPAFPPFPAPPPVLPCSPLPLPLGLPPACRSCPPVRATTR